LQPLRELASDALELVESLTPSLRNVAAVVKALFHTIGLTDLFPGTRWS
jgi:hypothetical protein